MNPHNVTTPYINMTQQVCVTIGLGLGVSRFLSHFSTVRNSGLTKVTLNATSLITIMY